MDQKNHLRESRTIDIRGNDTEIFFYSMRYDDPLREPAENWRIWGVTAGVIRMVQERVYGGVAE